VHKGFLITAALLGALSVILGASAAHALKTIISTEQIIVFETGIRYQFYHVFALMAVGVLYKEFANNFLRWAGMMFCIGILFFSGSLYFLALSNGPIQPAFRWIYLITPLGGLCFITGWLLLAVAIIKKN
jgi:uncharacterized membrane protein YgdD (TMEM256/DUF423 family)